MAAPPSGPAEHAGTGVAMATGAACPVFRSASALRSPGSSRRRGSSRQRLVGSDVAEEAPAWPRWWKPLEALGGAGRKRGRLPSRRPLSRSARAEEMAPEAIIELPVSGLRAPT